MTNFTRIVVLFVMFLAISHISATELPDISIESNRVLVCAHRANCGDTPENSLSAIKACIEAGGDMIEIDVARTKDGKLVLMHDAKVDRTTNGSGAIKNLPWDEVKKLRLRKRGKRELTKERIPTLKEVLELCKGRIYVNLDMKGASIFDCEDVIKTSGTESIIMYLATSLDWLKKVTAKFPKMIISPRMDFRRKSVKWPGKDNGLKFLKPYEDAIDVWGLDFTDLNHPAASKKNLLALNEKNIRVWTLTLNDVNCGFRDRDAIKRPAEVWGKLVGRNINVIMTDESEALIKYLKTIKRH